MPIRKWIFQYTIALPVIFVVLAGVQYLKGREMDYAIEFGMLWSVLSVAIFAARRAYMYRKNVECALCNDLQQSEKRPD